MQIFTQNYIMIKFDDKDKIYIVCIVNCGQEM